jgi:hypothetical protein
VSVVRGGGIAGISTRTTLVGDDLPGHEVETLSRLVQQAGLVRGAAAGSAAGGADQQLYEVEVVDDAGRVSARFGEEDLPDEVRELVAWIDARPERSRQLLT